MSSPNIDMIASSLRNCSLGRGGRGGPPSPPPPAPPGLQEASDESEGVTVDLNSDVALPYRWEQCLDIRTGQVYYINREDGTRTTVDPRAALYYSSGEASSSPASSCCSSSSGQDSASGDATADSADTSLSSNLSSLTPTEASSSTSGSAGGSGCADHVLVAAGCRACFMYFMVPKHGNACPKCGGGLLHLGGGGC